MAKDIDVGVVSRNKQRIHQLMGEHLRKYQIYLIMIERERRQKHLSIWQENMEV